MNTNDPKLTAYVLGELSEPEIREVQTALDADAALQTEVDAIRATVAQIETAMRAEKLPTPGVLENPEAGAASPHTPRAHAPGSGRTRLLIAVSLLALGAVGLLFGVPAFLSNSLKKEELVRSADVLQVQSEAMADAKTKKEVDGMTESLRASVLEQWSVLEEDTEARNKEMPSSAKPSTAVHSRVSETSFDQSVENRRGRPGMVPQSNRPLNLELPTEKADANAGTSDATMSIRGVEKPLSNVSGPAKQEERQRNDFYSQDPAGTRAQGQSAPQEKSETDGFTLSGQLGDDTSSVAGTRLALQEGEKGKKQEQESDESASRRSVTESKPGSESAPEVAGKPGPGAASPFSPPPASEPLMVAGGAIPSQTPAEKKPSSSPSASSGPVNKPRTFSGGAIYGRASASAAPSPDRRMARLSGKNDISGLSAPNTFTSDYSIQTDQSFETTENASLRLDIHRDDPHRGMRGETYGEFKENAFVVPEIGKFSTFSIDVDTASYTTVRRHIQGEYNIPKNAVRLEEMINYFKYDYPKPTGDKPFATHVEVVRCPWQGDHLLARIGIKGKELSVEERPALNLVFLIDVSGSMSSSNRLPLVKRGLTELVEMLQPRDRVAIVTYAGQAGVKLPSVSGSESRAILDSIESLSAGGSTAGASGIKLAYETARKYYDKAAQNRVILCTDGDFNVGTTDNKTLEQMIADEAKSGVFLTVLGFGMGNYKDERLKILSKHGNGNYGYVDSFEEARRLLVENLTGTLFTIAKDVKIQVDFNPARVAAYRLLGYENRKLRDEDFHDDTKDAGEIGAGHTVTALYEIVPVGVSVPQIPPPVDKSRYAENISENEPRPVVADKTAPTGTKSRELMFVKLRYKKPEGTKSALLEYPVVFDAEERRELTPDMRFASAVALFGMLLRDSKYAGDGSYATVLELAADATKDDKYRKEFVELVKKRKDFKGEKPRILVEPRPSRNPSGR